MKVRICGLFGGWLHRLLFVPMYPSFPVTEVTLCLRMNANRCILKKWLLSGFTTGMQLAKVSRGKIWDKARAKHTDHRGGSIVLAYQSPS